MDNTAIAIGKFEALHKGHGILIESTVEYARSCGLSAVLMNFEPHPAKILFDKDYKPLYTRAEQGLLLDKYDIDHWIHFPFDRSLTEMPAGDFCRLLIDRYNCRALLAGEGFRFGRGREGTIELVRSIGLEAGLEAVTIPDIRLDGEKISTSRIREHLANGRVKEANNLLGRNFFIMGKVQKGRQLGRTIGFPTANIHPGADKFLPPDGVYAATVIIGDISKAGVTNIGTNPTVADGQIRKVETNIFGFDGDIYGQDIVVELRDFIRPERVFKGVDELKRQIAEDASRVR